MYVSIYEQFLVDSLYSCYNELASFSFLNSPQDRDGRLPRGVPQGSTLGALLFLCTARGTFENCFSNKTLSNSTNLKDIKHNSNQFKRSQYIYSLNFALVPVNISLSAGTSRFVFKRSRLEFMPRAIRSPKGAELTLDMQATCAWLAKSRVWHKELKKLIITMETQCYLCKQCSDAS